MSAIGDWTRQAACAGRPDLMDPPTARLTTAALALCRSCPVLQQCRDWALALSDRSDPGGIAGGMTEEERSRLRSNLARRAVTYAQLRAQGLTRGEVAALMGDGRRVGGGR